MNNSPINFEKRDFEKQDLNNLVLEFEWKDFFADIASKNLDFLNIFHDKEKGNFLEIVSFYEENKSEIERKIRDTWLVSFVDEMINNFREILFAKNADETFNKMLENFMEWKDELEKDLKNIISEFTWESEILDVAVLDEPNLDGEKKELANNIHDSVTEVLVDDSVSKMWQLSNSIKSNSENIETIDGKKSALKEKMITALWNIKWFVVEFSNRFDSTSKEEFEWMGYWFSYEEWKAAKEAFKEVESQVENLSDIKDINVENILKENIEKITWMESVVLDVNEAYKWIDENISEVNSLLEKYSEVVDFKEIQLKEEIKILSIISVIHAVNIFASKIDNSIDLSLSEKSLHDAIDMIKNTEWIDFDVDKLFEEMEKLSGLMFVKNLIWKNKEIEEWKQLCDDLDELMKIELNADDILNEMFWMWSRKIEWTEIKKLDNWTIDVLEIEA